MLQIQRPRVAQIGIAALILLLPFIYFFPAVLGKVLLAPGDGWSQIFGIRVLMGQMLAKGELPMWNPYIFGGMPLLASIQPGALYPPSWFFAVFTPKLAMNLMIITTYHLALAGTYLYARKLGQSRLGALTAALAFAFGGYMVSHLGHSNRIAAAAWLPWILLAIEELYHQPRWRWVSIGAASIALQLFAGEPQMTCYTAIVAGAYTLFTLTMRPAQGQRRVFIGALTAMCVCGGLLSAIQLLPEGEMLRYTERSAISYEYFTQFSLPPSQIIGFFFPYFFGGAAFDFYKADYWGRWNPTETCGYVGMIVWLFVIIALSLRRKTAVQRFWIVWAVFALALALGENLPFRLYHIMHQVPVYKLFRAPGRHLLEFNFAIGLLAGFGITAVANLETRIRWRLVVISTAVLSAIIATCLVLYRFYAAQLKTELPLPSVVGDLSNPDIYVPVVLFVMAVLALCAYARNPNMLTTAAIVVLVTLDAMSFGYFYEWRLQSFDLAKRMRDPASVRFIKERDPDWRGLRIASASLLPFKDGYDMLDYPNVSIVRGLQSVNGYDPMRLLRTTDIAGHMTLDGWMDESETLADSHRGFDLLNVKYLLLETSSKETINLDGVKFNAEPSQLKFMPGTKMAFEVSATATELAVVTAMGSAIDLPTGTPVIEFKLTTKDGRVITHQMLAGRDTGEWAYDRAEVRAVIKHIRPPVIESWPVDGFDGHRYLARFKFDRSIITRVEAAYIAPIADLTLFRAALFDADKNHSSILSSFNLSLNRWRFLEQFDSVSVYENTHYLPRAWFVRNWHVAPSIEVLQAIKTGMLSNGKPFDPRETVLLEREIYGDRPTNLLPPGDPTGSEVKLTRHGPHRIDLQTRNAQMGFLVLSEIYYRGWEAWIDGKRVPVQRANYTLRGISVPAGEHRIRFVFRSPSLRQGAVLSGIGLLLLLLGGLYQFKKGDPPNFSGWKERFASWRKSLTPFALVMMCALLAYFGWLLRNGAYAVGGSDAAGYANLARALTQGELLYEPEPLKLFNFSPSYLDNFRPLGTVPSYLPGKLAQFYPIGYALHMAAGAVLLGWKNGPFVISPLAAMFCVMLVYLLGLEVGLSRQASAIGAMLLAIYPVFLFMTFQPMSDVTATCWVLLAILAALRSHKDERWSILAGMAFGVTFLIRPSCLLLLLPLAISLRFSVRSLLYFGLGGAPLALLFFSYNWLTQGNLFKTSYAAAGLFDALKVSYFAPRFQSYAHWLIVSLSPLPLLGWLVSLFDKRWSGRTRFLLLTWFSSFFLFHCFYQIYEGWTYLRFLLPCVPALLIGLMLTAQSLQERWLSRLPSWLTYASATLLCLTILGVSAHMIKQQNILNVGVDHYVNSRSIRWAQPQIPPNSVIVSLEMSAALRFYADRSILRWDLTSTPQWQTISSRITNNGWQMYALLMPHEIPLAQEKLPGEWVRLGDYQNISLWQVNITPDQITR